MGVAYGDDLRAGLLAGINEMADAVRVTLGPAGRNVTMHQKKGVRDADYSDADTDPHRMLSTNDGVTITRAVVFPDPMKNMGASLLREAALSANDAAGDGTTTAVVIAQVLINKAFRNVAAGADPLALRRGVEAAGAAAQHALEEAAIPAETEEELARIATVSCQDADLGALIARGLVAVGREGVLAIDDSRLARTELEIEEGIVFNRGLVSPYFAQDPINASTVLNNPLILLTDKTVTSSQELIPVLEFAAQENREFLLICDGLEGSALSLMVGCKREGGMNVAAVLAPEYGEGRRWRMEDMAVQTGGLYVTSEMGLSLADVQREWLGTARLVSVERSRTSIVDGGGDPQAVADRVAQLRYYAENTSYEFNQKRHAERLAKFVSGVATIKVGGYTTAEQAERKMRVEDAVNATRAAYEEGMVPGGGVALFNAARHIDADVLGLAGDERLGARIVERALCAPVRRIVENAGLSGSVVEARLRELPDGMGYDVVQGGYVNMLEAGIADPLRVSHSALVAAVSLAKTALVVEAGVTKKGNSTNGATPGRA